MTIIELKSKINSLLATEQSHERLAAVHQLLSEGAREWESQVLNDGAIASERAIAEGSVMTMEEAENRLSQWRRAQTAGSLGTKGCELMAQ